MYLCITDTKINQLFKLIDLITVCMYYVKTNYFKIKVSFKTKSGISLVYFLKEWCMIVCIALSLLNGSSGRKADYFIKNRMVHGWFLD